MDHAMIISSDGHAMAKMRDYRSYLPKHMHDDFDTFCDLYAVEGSPSFDPRVMMGRMDPDVIERWVHDMHDRGRLEGSSDPVRRLEIMEEEGIVAEELFPDFGLPFELSPPTIQHATGAVKYRERSHEEIVQGQRAHNRWLRDFCSNAPDRFVPMLTATFGNDVEAVVEEIRWGKAAGFKGVVVPFFDEKRALFDTYFDPIWATMAELDMPANSHVALSGTMPTVWYSVSGLMDKSLTFPLHRGVNFFRCHEVLNHLIWGGRLGTPPEVADMPDGTRLRVGASEPSEVGLSV